MKTKKYFAILLILILLICGQGKNARWYSSDSAYPNRPELVVNYTVTYDVALLAREDNNSTTYETAYFDPVSDYFSGATGTSYITENHFSSISNSSLISTFANRKYIYILTHGQPTQLMTAAPNTWFDMSSLNGVSFNGTKFIFLLSCLCGYGGYTPSHTYPSGTPVNLVEKLVQCGATTVVGFKVDMATSDLTQIAIKFTEFMLEEGQTVSYAMSHINPQDLNLTDQNYLQHYVIGGGPFTTWE